MPPGWRRMATATPAVPRSQGRQLAELILAESARAGLGAGGRLPTERQLAADMGVTRSAVRHAMKMLEAEGRVSREVGRGTFLREPAGTDGASGSGGGSQRLDDVGPADVMAVRRLLEPLVMPLVVAWATARDFEEMDRCLAGGERRRRSRNSRHGIWPCTGASSRPATASCSYDWPRSSSRHGTGRCGVTSSAATIRGSAGRTTAATIARSSRRCGRATPNGRSRPCAPISHGLSGNLLGAASR